MPALSDENPGRAQPPCQGIACFVRIGYSFGVDGLGWRILFLPIEGVRTPAGIIPLTHPVRDVDHGW